jgi:gamma-butyrobetaine dioxygenase
MIENAFGTRTDAWRRWAVDEVMTLFAERGATAYLGEPVSQLEHALQAAQLAESEGASRSLITAALLHDVGHLLVLAPAHEVSGCRWLEERFLPVVADAARLHVDAKRYLCAVESEYFQHLSEASILSLTVQGGPFSSAEAQQFEQEPFYLDAVRVRRWDDGAKEAGLRTPPLAYYRPLLEACCL